MAYGILAKFYRSSQFQKVVVINHGFYRNLGLLYFFKKLMCSIIFKSYQSFTRPNPTTRLPFFRIEIHEPVKPGSDQMTDWKRLVAKRTPWAALKSRWFLERTTHWKTWRGHGSVNKWERMNERTDEWTFFSQLLPLQAAKSSLCNFLLSYLFADLPLLSLTCRFSEPLLWAASSLATSVIPTMSNILKHPKTLLLAALQHCF